MSGKKILAFEADPLYAKILTEQLGARGLTVEIVTDGADGLERAIEMLPDLIYLCVELPRISGFSVCQKLRKHPKTERIPILISSSDANAEDTFEKHKKLKVRADEYLRKPFDASRLIAVVDSILHLAPAEEEILVADDSVDDGDEIELEEGDDLDDLAELEDVRPGNAAVDAEVDRFTDDAFASLSLDEEKPKPAAPPATPKRPAPAAPAAPSAKADNAEEKRLAGEVERLKRENDGLQTELRKTERDLAEARTNAATAAASAASGKGPTSREMLDLRELLNKKDRELLDAKDSVNNKEKQLLDYRERISELERGKADLEDKNIGLEKHIADLDDKISALTADKDVVTKKADDLASRLDRTQLKLQATEGELDAEKAGRKADLEQAAAERSEAERRLTADKDAEREQAVREQARLDDEKLARALSQQMAELDAEHAKAQELALTEQRLRHESEKDELAEAHEKDKAAALAARDASHAEQVDKIKVDHQHVVDDLKIKLYDGEQKIAQLKIELGDTKAALDSTRDELLTTQTDLDQTREREHAAVTELEETKGRLRTTSSDLETTRTRLSDREARVRELEALLADREARVAALEAENQELSEILDRNAQIVEKARQALGIATKLLDDVDLGGDPA